jgi:hypothetical protein
MGGETGAHFHQRSCVRDSHPESHTDQGIFSLSFSESQPSFPLCNPSMLELLGASRPAMCIRVIDHDDAGSSEIYKLSMLKGMRLAKESMIGIVLPLISLTSTADQRPSPAHSDAVNES